MKKCQMENSEIIWKNYLEKLFQVFFFLSFQFSPTAKIENLDLKITEKSFWDFWDSKVSEFKFSTGSYKIGVNNKYLIKYLARLNLEWRLYNILNKQFPSGN